MDLQIMQADEGGEGRGSFVSDDSSAPSRKAAWQAFPHRERSFFLHRLIYSLMYLSGWGPMVWMVSRKVGRHQ